ncbi:hypothetical protein CHU94_05535 [Rhodoferax sp. TH121]|nr:hypothetical protein CHU94_05535 [Rhodoferax sp. TH121]
MRLTALNHLFPEAPAILAQVLDLQAGPLESPVRSEVFGEGRFSQHGRSLGISHRYTSVGQQRESFTPRLRNNIQRLRLANLYIGSQAQTGYDISPAAEWLLENFHLLEAQFKEVYDGLPRSYFQSLPVLVQAPLEGLPRVYGVAWAFVAHTDGAFDEDLLVRFLRAYQETCALNLSELWALPTTLRVVLMENLRRLADRVAANKAARELANICCDDLDRHDVAQLKALLDLLRPRGVGGVFLAQMALRMQATVLHSNTVYKDWLYITMPDVAEMLVQQRADQAADNVSVSNSVTSLRAIGDTDWASVIGQVDIATRLLLESPAFQAEHPLTREDTLHAVEALAKRSARSEAEVARALLAAMAQANPDHLASTVPAYWLQGEGAPALRHALGMGAAYQVYGPDLIRRMALPVYLLTIVCSTAGLVWWLLTKHWAPGLVPRTVWSWLALGLLGISASEAMVALVNRLVSESVRPARLPRLAFLEGITPAHRVLVVIPGMLVNSQDIDTLVHRLQLHYLANTEEQAQFALLTDWLDAPTHTVSGDAGLLAHALQCIVGLNQKYPRADGESCPRFVLLHRERRYSESEQRWIGWERKRGKLEQLIAALAHGNNAGFVDLGHASCLRADTRYVLTLDADTQLPSGRLRSLVGIAAHPINHPRVDPVTRTVVAGYGILQPRVATPLPAHNMRTPYHWLFSGQYGIDPYSAASSEVYQDIFAQGTFTGKGLLHVQALYQVLAGRLPDERVLSHDLLEGALARCAAVTDVTVLEDAPHHPDVAYARIHRWTRGDWQLLPFILRARQYGITAINLWKMLDNLRRSLVAPAAVGLLLLSVCGVGLSPAWALGLVFSAYTAGPLMGAFAGLFPSRPHVALRYFYAQAGTELLRALCVGAWQLAQLLRQSALGLDAMVRAMYRMLVSGQGLLEWTTAASAQASAKTGLAPLLRQHWPVSAMSLVLAAVLVRQVEHPVYAYALFMLWWVSPVGTWLVSRVPQVRTAQSLSESDHLYLGSVARDTWRFFERCVTREDNYLPPDNLQVVPSDQLAHRTSPTNIGLYLLSTACAAEFGWIGTGNMLDRMEQTLATLRTLQRYRGHFFNWYDTQTLAPLLPVYVSTVDSGNLSGHLLASSQACLARARMPDTAKHRVRLQALALALQGLAWEAEYGFLYNAKRRLFHIGYRVLEQELDASYYDLLASESRLTSLLAIAKGDVPVVHWAALGRMHYVSGLQVGLRSWSGSMFEYLMPLLVLAEPMNSVLQVANAAAVQAQQAYGTLRGVPWGISESAYAGRDSSLAYQYAPQGAPALALRRTPAQELVVAPYATALAALVDPVAAVANLRCLEALGARQACGFIEALDYTPARQSGSEPFTLVVTYMAHHQGMCIVALANVLMDGVVQRWGMADPHLEAASALLHERLPKEVSQYLSLAAGSPLQMLRHRVPGLLRNMPPGATAVEPSHLLSNGNYSVALRPNGAGWSRWKGVGVSRWRDDALRDAYGTFFYLRTLSGPFADQRHSLTQHPVPDPQAEYGCTFHADRVVLSALWPHLRAQITVWVSPEDDIEFRQIEICNLEDENALLELSSALEITLARAEADAAHPAFSSLFINTQWLEPHRALLMERKARIASEAAVSAVHFLAHTDASVRQVRACADRLQWAGRNRKPGHDSGWSDTAAPPHPYFQDPEVAANGLDPVAALVVRIHLAPHAKTVLTFATAAAPDAQLLHALLDKYQQANHLQRASLMSATLTGIRLRALRISPENYAAVQSLTTALLLVLNKPHIGRAFATPPPGVVCDKSVLWRWGISGDRPIILVSIAIIQGLGLVRALAQGLRLWAWGGVDCDLVVINSEPVSYQQPLQRELLEQVQRLQSDCPPGRAWGSAHFFALRHDVLSADERSTLHVLARIHIDSDGRPLAHHVAEWEALHQRDALLRQQRPSQAVGLAGAQLSAQQVSVGSFDTESGDFAFEVAHHVRPLRPWANVLANAEFGTVLTETGGGYTWARNSRMNQLTPWSNDPVADPPGEWLMLQDRRTLETWSLAPNAWGDMRSAYTVVHGPGGTHITHQHGPLHIHLHWCVDPHTAVKQMQLQIHNRGERQVALRLVALVEWVMGAVRQDRASTFTSCHQETLVAGRNTVLLCHQRERSGGLGGGTAFLATKEVNRGGALEWTCDRREFFDAGGGLVMPTRLASHGGDGLDPCAALSQNLSLEGGEHTERVFLVGYAPDATLALNLAHSALRVPAAKRGAAVQTYWEGLLNATQVHTPDPLFDVLVNRWLLYQAVVCRLYAKAGLYQAGGATGYRDQLQDAMALTWAQPELLRAQIELCASRQFEAGDVQHWWHSPLGAGVRTHISDDLLWLPFACSRYLHATGDAALLEAPVAFLQGQDIPAGAEDIYFTPGASAEQAAVYEHAARAIDHSLRHGAHDLPLMGAGDWNDGMNAVGPLGRGESVWLGWFVCYIVRDWAPRAEQRGELDRAQRWREAAARWEQALHTSAWDGAWFHRAYFDDGQVLGASHNVECRIDLIAQAWAVLSGVASPEQQATAMASAHTELVDPHSGLIRLLTPPLQHMVPRAGYIQSYPPGVRENGGQYCHAGVWALMAQARLASAGHTDLPYTYFTYLSPAHRSQDPVHGPVYGLEPYVMAGDVYAAAPYVGRGGWSWYTGSAGLMHRAALESIMGLQQGATELWFMPCLPAHWPEASLHLQREGCDLHFTLQRLDDTEIDARALALNATVLQVGERLAWRVLAGPAHYLVPIRRVISAPAH